MLRISWEFIRGFRTLHFVGPCVTVFGSARFAEDHPYYGLARRTGALLARAGLTVMTGGGPGIMEAANRGASEAKGLSVGLTISIPDEEFDNPYISRELDFYFHYFFMRKFWFVYLAKAVVLFPGGYGTLDELFEILTLVQTHKMRKRMPIVLFGSEYWDGVINFDALVKYGTISPGDLAPPDPEPGRLVADRDEAANPLLGGTGGSQTRRWRGESTANSNILAI